MNQSKLLKIAIEKAGGKKQLSELTKMRLAYFYEAEKGKAIKFDDMIKILNAVNLALIPIETNVVINPTATDCINAIINTLNKTEYFK
jgi:hypothetical protein